MVVCAVELFAGPAFAKRRPPTKVDPVVIEGIRYIAPNHDPYRGYVEAWDVQTNQKLWEVTIFRNRIDPNLEEDVQHVFIKSLTPDHGKLLVGNEKNRSYTLDLKTRAVEGIEIAEYTVDSKTPAEVAVTGNAWFAILGIFICVLVAIGLYHWLLGGRRSKNGL
jgi:hypothetical protein